MFDVKFIEALAYALERDVILGDEYYHEITALQRKQTVSIAGLAQIDQVKHVMGKVNEALDNGTTFKQFQNAVKSGDIDIGLPKHRLDNIFRTNIQSAYNYGKWRQQERTKKYRPYRMYDAINDSRTRPSHLACDGVIRHCDDPWWDTHTAPLGYRCRCTTRSLTQEQAERYGITPDDKLPYAGADSSDWGQSPRLYNDNIEQVVKTRISELMLEYTADSSKIVMMSFRLAEAVKEVLIEPVIELAVLMTQAQQLIDDTEL